MKNIYNKFLIVSTFLLFIGGIYLYFSKDLNNKDIIPVAFGSSLESSLPVVENKTSTDKSKKITQDTAFLKTLTSLNKITIDTLLFDNPSFKALKNNAVKIEKVEAGRINPFAPILVTPITGDMRLSDITTNQPTEITDKTAVLNGTINTKTGVTDIYFEYGSTEALGTKGAIVKQSLVGTFVENISKLSPKTTYFFKACAKINNVASCGDVVSFTTK
jgi:hypothetical protein